MTQHSLSTRGSQNVAYALLRHDAVVVTPVALALIHPQILAAQALAENEAQRNGRAGEACVDDEGFGVPRPVGCGVKVGRPDLGD